MYRIGAVTKTNGLQKHIHIKRERQRERGTDRGTLVTKTIRLQKQFGYKKNARPPRVTKTDGVWEDWLVTKMVTKTIIPLQYPMKRKLRFLCWSWLFSLWFFCYRNRKNARFQPMK